MYCDRFCEIEKKKSYVFNKNKDKIGKKLINVFLKIINNFRHNNFL